MIGKDRSGLNGLNAIEVVATLKFGVANKNGMNDGNRWNYTYTFILCFFFSSRNGNFAQKTDTIIDDK
ncbi:MAG: hypothetical protein FWF53_11380 [Candidatus Azobacteroides sp.]|nr:hypothetical protein [Candidatus Azobacteroides sp.]